MQTTDKKVGFRVEYDDRHGAHVNVWAAKQKETFTFQGDESMANQIVKQFMTIMMMAAQAWPIVAPDV